MVFSPFWCSVQVRCSRQRSSQLPVGGCSNYRLRLRLSSVPRSPQPTQCYYAVSFAPDRYPRRCGCRCGLIAWFGPRGLSSLLLVLLPVFAGLPGAERLFALTCLVVLLSVVVHGGSLMLLHRRRQRGQSSAPDAEMSDLASPSATPGPTAPQLTDATRTPEVLLEEDEIISIKEVQRLRRAGVPVVVIDARSKRAYEVSDGQAQGALRLAPDNPLRYATELKIPRDAWLAIYCECPNDEGSHTVAERLRRAGWPRARALKGGWEAWQAHGMPVESRSSASVLRMHQTRP
jgi:NhaP-type Na+/H+ and K+/H+ antiporters